MQNVAPINWFRQTGVRWSAAAFSSLFLLFFPLLARADNLPAPTLKPGQFVYTVPGDFDPPYIGKAGLGQIQNEARKLLHPFYVVVAKEYGGTTTEQLSDAIDELVDNWARDPKFDRATTSVAILTYSPRKFRLLPGSTWRVKLGLEGQGSQRFVDIFSTYTQGSSKDPKTGIIESMKALDAFVFEATDPKRIAIREAQAKINAEKKRLQEATQLIQGEIFRTESLLAQKSFLPSDVSALTNALAKAKALGMNDGPSRLQEAASELQIARRPFETVVNEKRRAYQAQIAEQERQRRVAMEAKAREEQRVALLQAQRIGISIAAFAILVALLFWQWRRFKTLSTRFQEKTSAWEEALLNAANNHTQFFEERRSVTELASASGKTKEKYDEVTRE
ncbi:hypothetical protein EON80_11105, partial [bacterium]